MHVQFIYDCPVRFQFEGTAIKTYGSVRNELAMCALGFDCSSSCIF